MNLSSLWKKEDWWAVWIGLFIIALVATNVVPSLPKISTWSGLHIFDSIKASEIGQIALIGVFVLALTAIVTKSMNKKVKSLIGFPVIFILAMAAKVICKQANISEMGLAYAIWALLFGLILSNIFKTPECIKKSAKSELFIKIGLVILGAEILFNVILQMGARGLFEVTIGLAAVWYFCYWLAKKFGLSKSFSAIMATATSVCGVSAALAAGGATKGDKKEISYVVSLVLLFAVPMVIIMPIVGKFFGIPDMIFGAWIGGTIDNTASVVASGALYSETAMNVASVVKLSQNILIGIVAFLLAAYWALKVEKKADEKKPKLIEIWYRFPKFIVGFLVASLIFSFVLVPTLGFPAVQALTKVTKGFRGWFFALTFVSIGINTNFKELIKIGRGKPLLVFLVATGWDLVISLISAYIFFGML